MRYIPSRRAFALLDQWRFAHLPWTGATWAVDGNGRAYNTPTYGSTLLTNGGMETFSSGQATGWTKGGTPTLTQEASIVQAGSSAQKMVSAGTGDFIYQYPTTTAGRFHEWSAYVYGDIRYIANTNVGASTILLATHSGAQWDQIFLTGQAIGSASGFFFGGPSGGGTGYVDNVSLREIAQGSIVATVTVNIANPTISTRLNALSATAGLVSKIDSQSNPQNFVSARFDGLGNLRLDKTVGGVVTNLQTNAVTFVPDALLELLWVSDTTVGVRYNGALVGAVRTVSDAGIISNTLYGLLSTHAGNLFSEFRVNGSKVPFVFFLASLETHGLFAIGDSKTGGDEWVALLIAGIQAATGQQWWEIGPRYGIGGASVGSMKTYVDSNLASVTGAAHLVTINLGANDVGSMPVEATFKANLTSIIDSVRAKWSGVKVYVDLTWSRSRTTEHDTLNGWKEDVIDSYAGDNVFVGMDERIWFENGDDGVTYSTGDGVHYNAAAQPVCAVEHRIAILGA